LNTVEDDGSSDFIVGRRVPCLGLVPWSNIGIDPIESFIDEDDGLVEIERDWVDSELPRCEWMSCGRGVFGVSPD